MTLSNVSKWFKYCIKHKEYSYLDFDPSVNWYTMRKIKSKIYITPLNFLSFYTENIQWGVKYLWDSFIYYSLLSLVNVYWVFQCGVHKYVGVVAKKVCWINSHYSEFGNAISHENRYKSMKIIRIIIKTK